MNNIYKFKNIDNGDILLEKIILDITNFTIIKKNNGDMILKKIVNINNNNIDDILQYNFKNSNILFCAINNNEIFKLKFKTVLENIYNVINDGTKIIKYSKLNIKTIIKKNEGFYYLKNLGISIQGVDSNKCIKEIIDQCIENKILLIIKIKLHDETMININVNF